MRELALSGMVFLAACGGGNTGPKTTAKPTPMASAPSSSLAAGIEPVSAVGCEVRTEGAVDAEGKLELFASLLDRDHGHVLARARYETATFFLPTGEGGQLAGVEASGWGMSFAALMRVEDVPLWVRPTRPIASGMMTPGPRTRVKVQQTGSGTLQVRLEAHELLDARRLPLVETVACTDLQATPPAWMGSGPGREIALRVGAEGLAVSVFPGAESEAGLIVVAPPGAGDDVLDARELERQGELVRVDIPSSDGAIRGWVVAASVMPPKHFSMGGPERSTPAPSPQLALTDRRVCESPLRLAALPPDKEEPVWLGEVRAGTTVGRDLGIAPGIKPGWSPIEVAGIEAQLVALTHEVDACVAPKDGEK